MNGTVFKRMLPSGRIDWCVNIDLGRDENGKRIRYFKGGFNRKADADTDRIRVLQEREQGEVVRPAPRQFRSFLEEWFKEHAEKHCERKTVERYRELAAYIPAEVLNLDLKHVSTLVLERMYNRLHESGGKGGRPLAAKTVRNIAGVVHGSFGTAIRWKLIRDNPSGGCHLPKMKPHEAKALDPAQTDIFLTLVRQDCDWLYPILLIAAATGCRRGELLALQWPDIEIAERRVTISKSLEQTKAGHRIKPTKNRRVRRFPLPETAIRALQEHFNRQGTMRAHFGRDYRADLNLVFGAPDGSYLKPDSITSKVCLAAKRVGLDGISLHSLRHSHGSHLLSAGVSLPTISKRLGHSSIRITAEVYRDAFTRDELAAADAWDTMMDSAAEENLLPAKVQPMRMAANGCTDTRVTTVKR